MGVGGASIAQIPRSQAPTPYPWNGPTRELPTVYSRGVTTTRKPESPRSAVVPPTPIAVDLRYVPRPAVARVWRPDLWPARVWAPLLLAPGIALGLVAILILHAVLG
jgi:hypothetical protein